MGRPMAIKEQIPLGLGIGAIVATMLFGTCRTERTMERQYNSLAQQMQQGFAEIHRRVDDTNQRIDDTNERIGDTNERIGDTNERIDDTHRRLDNLQTQIGEIRDDVRELRSIHLGTADAGPGVD